MPLRCPVLLVPVVAAMALLGCSHSDPFVAALVGPLPPFGAGPDVQLTFNVDQDYWPAWTQDGRGILYAFVDQEDVSHRCLGLLPPAGGRRIWQLCDNRAVRDDTVSSYSAFALDSTGHLLVVEALSSKGFAASYPFHIRLELTDTAKPYVRTTLLTLPVTVGTTPVSWISDLTWTGPNTFLMLGQLFQMAAGDSIFGSGNGIVLAGTIVAGQLTLAAVAGTDSATSYSLAENGVSIVYTRHHDLRLFKVPVGGGTPVPAPILRTTADTISAITGELLGVSCQGSTCIVAHDAVLLADSYYESSLCPDCFVLASFLGPGPMALHRVSLASGADDVVYSGAPFVILATPQLSPVSGDVVVQVGGIWGHAQTKGDSNSDLHLLKGLVP